MHATLNLFFKYKSSQIQFVNGSLPAGDVKKRGQRSTAITAAELRLDRGLTRLSTLG